MPSFAAFWLHMTDLNTYLLASDIVNTGLYFTEGALAYILSYHVVTDAPALVRWLLPVAATYTLASLALSLI